jgi:hypothetical protein
MGTTMEFTTIVIMLLIFVNYTNAVGAVAAVIALVAGRLAANIYLMRATIHLLKR